MTTVLTKNAVQEALDKAIAERGADYRYTDTHGDGCFYADWDEATKTPAPSCVVGFVVDAIDHATFEALARTEATEGTFSAPEIADYGLAQFEDEDVQQALAFAQEAQDEGLTWGQAREFAIRYLEGERYSVLRDEMADALAAIYEKETEV